MGYYDHYKGSRTQKRKRRLLITAFVLLLFIFAFVALLIFGDFMTYSSDGFHFNWPFQQEEAKDPTASDGKDDTNPSQPENPDYVIDDKPADSNPLAPPSFSLTEGQTGLLLVDAATFLTRSTVALPQNICNGYATLVKDAAGIRYLSSAIDKNTTQGLSGDAAKIAEAAAGYTTGQVPVSAVVSAFPDNILPRKTYISSGIKSGKSVWQDGTGSSWLNPYASGSQAILVELVKQCKKAGFQEIIFTDFRFPTAEDGDISSIMYNTSKTKADALAAVARKLSGIAGNDIKLSCVLTDVAARQLVDEVSGQSVEALLDFFDRFYIQTTDASEDITTLKNALSAAECELAFWVAGDEIPASFPVSNFVLAGKAN